MCWLCSFLWPFWLIIKGQSAVAVKTHMVKKSRGDSFHWLFWERFNKKSKCQTLNAATVSLWLWWDLMIDDSCRRTTCWPVFQRSSRQCRPASFVRNTFRNYYFHFLSETCATSGCWSFMNRECGSVCYFLVYYHLIPQISRSVQWTRRSALFNTIGHLSVIDLEVKRPLNWISSLRCASLSCISPPAFSRSTDAFSSRSLLPKTSPPPRHHSAKVGVTGTLTWTPGTPLLSGPCG